MTSETAKSAIYVEGLKKTYLGNKKNPGKEALKGINLNIPKGSIYGLLGPNGAGKSTLINILAGLVNKTSGKITVNGDDMDDDARKTRYHIGVVPQEVVLDPFFTVREALEQYAGYYGIRKKDRRTDELLSALHLADKSGVNSRRLSGGMKRRVLIAKALVHNPPILILDEPTAGVDVELRSQLWEYVHELNKRGTTILLTTHYLEEAEELCDYIAIINHGEIIVDKKKSELIGMMGRKRLILKLSNIVSEIPQEFSGFDCGIIDTNTFMIDYKTNETSIRELLEMASRAGLEIKDLSTEETDLEDIFKHLVKKAA